MRCVTALAFVLALSACGGHVVELGGGDGGSFGEGGGTESGTGDAFSGGAGQAGNGGSSGGGGLSAESTVYMAIDKGGAQHRDLFFTNSPAIYCVVSLSSGTQDATVDFTIQQIASADGGPPLHPIFAGGEIVSGPSTESPVAYKVPHDGLQITFNCRGQCVKNGVKCPAGYLDQGVDTAGVGGTCCYDPTAMPASCSGVIPYPAGTYKCVVQIDGVRQSEAPTFQIQSAP